MRDVEAIREAAGARPFRPFALKMVDGSEFAIDHPDWISIPPVRRPRDVYIYVVRGSGEEADYRTHWVDVGLISQVIVPGRAEVHRAATGES